MMGVREGCGGREEDRRLGERERDRETRRRREGSRMDGMLEIRKGGGRKENKSVGQGEVPFFI